MRPRIGLLFRYGAAHDANTKYLQGLNDTEELKNLGVVPLDWRYKLTDEKEEDVFKHADQTYKDFCTSQYIIKEMCAFLKSRGSEPSEVKKIEEITSDMYAEYSKAHDNKDLRSIAKDKEIYKFSINQTMSEAIDNYLDKVDGIYVPGWMSFDLEAAYCLDNPTRLAPDTRREKFERELIKRAVERGIPVLGICAGSWLVASCFQGAKTQVLGEEALKTHDHQGMVTIDETPVQVIRVPVHDIEVTPGTMLHGIVKNAKEWKSKPGQEKTLEHEVEDKSTTDAKKDDALRMKVNSTHWRVVVADAKGTIDTNNLLVISAVEPGHKSIEAFETRFGVPVVGIQFHPEYRMPVLITKNKITPDLEYPANRKVMQSFAECSKTFANKKALMGQVKTQAQNFFTAAPTPTQHAKLKQTGKQDDPQKDPQKKPGAHFRRGGV